MRATWGGGRLHLRGKLLRGVLLWAGTQASHHQQGAPEIWPTPLWRGEKSGKTWLLHSLYCLRDWCESPPSSGSRVLCHTHLTVLLREKRTVRRAISNPVSPPLPGNSLRTGTFWVELWESTQHRAGHWGPRGG